MNICPERGGGETACRLLLHDVEQERERVSMSQALRLSMAKTWGRIVGTEGREGGSTAYIGSSGEDTATFIIRTHCIGSAVYGRGIVFHANTGTVVFVKDIVDQAGLMSAMVRTLSRCTFKKEVMEKVKWISCV